MSESYYDQPDAYEDLGGHEPAEISVESARAMLSAGLGGDRVKAIVARADAQDSMQRYTDENLSGIAVRTPEQEQGVQNLKADHLADAAFKAMGNGSSVEFNAKQRAKRERRERRF